MSSEEVITHGGADRAYRLCRCGQCGHESRCTPDNAFYTASGDPTGPLRCEKCMRSGWATSQSCSGSRQC